MCNSSKKKIPKSNILSQKPLCKRIERRRTTVSVITRSKENPLKPNIGGTNELMLNYRVTKKDKTWICASRTYSAQGHRGWRR